VEIERQDRLKAVTVGAHVLLASYPDALVWALDAGGNCTAMPDGVPLQGQQVMGGRSMIDYVVAQDRVVVASTFLTCHELGGAAAPVRLLSDPTRWMTLNFADLRDTYGILMAIVVADSVGHEPYEVGELLHASPTRYATLRENEVGIVLGCDEGAVRMFGWTEEEVVGKGALDLIHPDDQARVIEGWMAMLNSTEHQQARVRRRRKDDTFLWIDLSLRNCLDDPRGPHVLVEMIDVSLEMATQEALAAREELLDRLAEALPVGLFQIDVDHRVIYWNERLHQILGSSPTEDLSELLATVVPADRTELDRAFTSVLQGADESDLEVDLVRPGEDEFRRCLVSSRTLNSRAGRAIGAIVCVSDITESARLREQLQERAHELEERTVELEDKATYDMLTRCHNRGSTMAALERALNRMPPATTGVIFVDIDDFKPVNDRLGHAAGDELLVVVAKLLASATREGDVVGRIGGDEFVVICRQVSEADAIVAVASRIARALNRQVTLEAGTTDLRASIGVACSEPSMSADTLVAHADEAMYRSKHEGGGRPVPYWEMSSDPADGTRVNGSHHRENCSDQTGPVDFPA
jgi:diguanylate cyclase (GGDEF)-like protein/PAS domain S-box-containing protein